MANLTINEIQELKIVRADYIGGSWRVLISSETGHIYVAIFDGAENDIIGLNPIIEE